MLAEERQRRARASLVGLHLGDAFGQQFFAPGALERVAQREPPPPIWLYTDDSAQAAVLFHHLRRNGDVFQDSFAAELAEEHHRDPMRGYGAGARQLLHGIHAGQPWRELSRGAFSGMGSYGNGAAMRVAPLGAWFADDVDLAVAKAASSAEVTHANRNAIDGAVAVVVATAGIVHGRSNADVWGDILARTSPSLTRDMLARASGLAAGCTARHAAEVLGSGRLVAAHDTAPFAIWAALTFRDSYEDCLWATVSAEGDMDTTSAIAGGILGATATMPRDWLRCVEPLRL